MIQDLYTRYIDLKVYTDEMSKCKKELEEMEKLEIEIIYHKDFNTFFPDTENIDNLSVKLVQKYIDEYNIQIEANVLRDRIINHVKNLHVFDRVIIDLMAYGWHYDLFRSLCIWKLV